MFELDEVVLLAERIGRMGHAHWNYGVISYCEAKVDRVTKTIAEVKGLRFKRDSGKACDENHFVIKKRTPENIKELDYFIQERKGRMEKREQEAKRRQVEREKREQKKLEELNNYLINNPLVDPRVLPDGSRLYEIILPRKGPEKFRMLFVHVWEDIDTYEGVELAATVIWLSDKSKFGASVDNIISRGTEVELDLVKRAMATAWNY